MLAIWYLVIRGIFNPQLKRQNEKRMKKIKIYIKIHSERNKRSAIWAIWITSCREQTSFSGSLLFATFIYSYAYFAATKGSEKKTAKTKGKGEAKGGGGESRESMWGRGECAWEVHISIYRILYIAKQNKYTRRLSHLRLHEGERFPSPRILATCLPFVRFSISFRLYLRQITIKEASLPWDFWVDGTAGKLWLMCGVENVSRWVFR